MVGHNIIVIGASAGGVEAVSQLVKLLPSDLPAALFVALHFPAYGVSVLPQILQRRSSFQVHHPYDQEPIQSGHIYVAPPDYHLLVQPGYIHLSRGPKENGHRPAIDPLFRSAAHAYRTQVIGVILSGMLDDGSLGLALIKSRGGMAIVQDPNEALFNAMPLNALKNVEVDYTLKLAEIAPRLESLVHQPVETVEPLDDPIDDPISDSIDKLIDESEMEPDQHEIEQDAFIVAQDKTGRERGEQPSGNPSPLTCPECGGVMWEFSGDNVLRYRCHTGHAYSAESLVAEQADALEGALWSAVRALEEKAALARRLAINAHSHQRSLSETLFTERAQESHHHAMLIREIISHNQSKPESAQEVEN